MSVMEAQSGSLAFDSDADYDLGSFFPEDDSHGDNDVSCTLESEDQIDSPLPVSVAHTGEQETCSGDSILRLHENEMMILQLELAFELSETVERFKQALLGFPRDIFAEVMLTYPFLLQVDCRFEIRFIIARHFRKFVSYKFIFGVLSGEFIWRIISHKPQKVPKSEALRLIMQIFSILEWDREHDAATEMDADWELAWRLLKSKSNEVDRLICHSPESPMTKFHFACKELKHDKLCEFAAAMCSIAGQFPPKINKYKAKIVRSQARQAKRLKQAE